MPRRERIDLPGITLHAVQRGIDRQVCFFEEEDYVAYRGWLAQGARHHRCEIHAYVLMTNHVHLLVTPRKAGAAGRVMQYLGRHYVRYVNRKYRRTGSLWEGRFKSSVIDSGWYLLRCQCYIELNPVRARLVSRPGQYRWSSVHWHGAGSLDPVLCDHAVYLALGKDTQSRCAAYRDLLRNSLTKQELEEIRAALSHSHVLGHERFKQQIEQMIGRRLGTGRPGRPARKKRHEGHRVNCGDGKYINSDPFSG